MWRCMSKEARTTYGKEYVEFHVEAAIETIQTANGNSRLLRAKMAPLLPEWFLDGLELHDVRNHPTPDALIGQENH
ncbi:hypothetical protein LSH36_58g15037 [Paralvinella palmiformis]|uniref:Uncharacterized protein n=1 Tax=Paralvinella palmiformis TaxID=53620 RepID=A0AAD9K4U1_9ANNE|nr:hypothetical protein LSH36_58g15037 [Paralvinella palmiformis]